MLRLCTHLHDHPDQHMQPGRVVSPAEVRLSPRHSSTSCLSLRSRVELQYRQHHPAKEIGHDRQPDRTN